MDNGPAKTFPDEMMGGGKRGKYEQVIKYSLQYSNSYILQLQQFLQFTLQ